MTMPEAQKALGWTANHNGYMLLYKGNPIGGAGVKLLRENRLHSKNKDARAFIEMAKYELHQLRTGHGAARYLGAIQEIDLSEKKPTSG